MGVIIKHAPPKASQVLVGCHDLAHGPCMADGKLLLPLFGIHRFCGKDGTCMFTYQIWHLFCAARGLMGGQQHMFSLVVLTVVIVTVYVLNQMAAGLPAHARGGAGRIHGLAAPVGFLIQLVIIRCLIQTRPPYDNTRMIKMSQHHVFQILEHNLFKLLIPDISPARNLLKNHKSQFVALIQEVP